MPAPVNSHASCVKFSRTWIDSFQKSLKMGVALPMLAMETEMKTQSTTRGGRGFTWVELLVVIGVVILLVAVLLPTLAASRRKSSKLGCVNCLKQIAIASRIWEGDNGDKYPMQLVATNDDLIKFMSNGNAYVLWQTMSNELSTPRILVCPEDKNHAEAFSFGIGFSDSNISYFLNLDADDHFPQMFLAGDDNFVVNRKPVQPGVLNLSKNDSVEWTKERHGGMGNIALTDGSVQTTTSAVLQQAIQQIGTATNRLVIP